MIRCGAKTRTGKQCRNPVVGSGDRCIAHLPRKDKDALGFGGPQPGSGRPRKPRVVEVLREKIEADVDRWLKVYETALAATRDGEPDHALRLRAVEGALDRAFGKPIARAEVEVHGEREPAPLDIPTAKAAEEAFRTAHIPEGIDPASIVPELDE